MPFNLSRRSNKYVTSGITRSIPSRSAVGNITPQSTAMAASPYSTSIILRPNSPKPPSGIIFRFSIRGSELVFLQCGADTRSDHSFAVASTYGSYGAQMSGNRLTDSIRQQSNTSRTVRLSSDWLLDNHFNVAGT